MTEPHLRTRYDAAQRALHWSMAIIIFTAIALGVYAALLPQGTSPRRELLDIHKSLGMTALFLAVLRLGYRIAVGEPRYRVPLGPRVHASARAAHATLYALMILMPIAGYLDSGAGGYSLSWFGLFSWPRLVPLDKPLSHLGGEIHFWGAWAMGAILALHLLAVVWHRLIKHDEVLSRMWPTRRTVPEGSGLAVSPKDAV